MVAFWKDWLRLQLANNMDRIVRDSIKDFHFPGLNYICFQFDPNLTIRLYIAHPDQAVETAQVSIHNHLYDSQLLVLCGWLRNQVYEMNGLDLVRGSEQVHRYLLTSALHPENKEGVIKLKRLGLCWLNKSNIIDLEPGEFHTQLHDEIHGVTNDPTSLTAWLVMEYPTVKKHSMLFSRTELGDTIPTPGCYQRYTEQEIRYLVNDVISEMA